MSDDGRFSTAEGEFRYHDGRWSMSDASGEFDPRAGGALPTPDERGQALLARTSGALVKVLPLTGPGWLVSDDGYLLEVG